MHFVKILTPLICCLAFISKAKSDWVQKPGCAHDIAVGADGSVYVIGCTPVGDPGGYKIYKWNGSDWDEFGPGGKATNIAVDQNGNPWVVNAGNNIYQWVP